MMQAELIYSQTNSKCGTFLGFQNVKFRKILEIFPFSSLGFFDWETPCLEQQDECQVEI